MATLPSSPPPLTPSVSITFSRKIVLSMRQQKTQRNTGGVFAIVRSAFQHLVGGKTIKQSSQRRTLPCPTDIYLQPVWVFNTFPNTLLLFILYHTGSISARPLFASGLVKRKLPKTRCTSGQLRYQHFSVVTFPEYLIHKPPRVLRSTGNMGYHS